MSEMGTAMIGTGEATGERRALRAAEGAIANPLFDDTSLKGARGVLISITGGKDLTLYEVDEAASRIRQEVDEEANIIVGAIVEPPSKKRCGCRSWRRESIRRPISGSNIHPIGPQPSRFSSRASGRRRGTRPREHPSAQSRPIHLSQRSRRSKPRLCHRPLSHFQSRLSGGGFWTRRRA